MDFNMSIWAFFGLTLFIDLGTLLFFYLFKSKEEKDHPDYNKMVSIVIPAHREEIHIKETIESAFREKKHYLKNVVVAGDKESHEMQRAVKELTSIYENLIYINCPDKSKAKKINFVISNYYGILAEYVYVRDAKVKGEGDCIHEMLSSFDDDTVAAVTSFGYLNKPKNFLSKFYHFGKSWVDDLGKFRKIAQEKRSAVFVVCGASTMYRKSVLVKIPMPCQSKTEDTYLTWVLQNNGYKIRVAEKAIVSANDIDGFWFSPFFAQLSQAYRWSSGTIQCLYCEGRNLMKNSRLFYTTILPGFIEATMYSMSMMLLPLAAFLYPEFAIGFLLGDTVFSLIGTAIIVPKKFFYTLIRYPGILFYKYLNAVLFNLALFNVTYQKLTKQSYKWSNEWNPTH